MPNNGNGNIAHEDCFEDQSTVSWLDDPWRSWAQTWTGQWVDPYEFPLTLLGFEDYLQTNGVLHFPAGEVTKPRYPSLAKSTCSQAPIDDMSGELVFLPGRPFWPRLLCPLLIAEHCRVLSDEPADLVHAYRPWAYNASVHSTGADHPSCCAVDVDVRSRRAWAAWMGRLQELYRAGAWLSVGFCSDGQRDDGGRRFHIGVLGPATVAKQAGPRDSQRDWDYNKGTTLRAWKG